MTDRATLSDVEHLAREINNDFTFNSTWAEMAQREDGAEMLAFARDVLQAELDQSFFSEDHAKSTLPQKPFLTPQRSIEMTSLLADVFPPSARVTHGESHFGDVDDARITEAGADMRRDGCLIWPDLLPKATVDGLIARLDDMAFTNRNAQESQLGRELRENGKHYSGAWWLARMDKLAAMQEFEDLAFDPVLINIAQEALGAVPIHVQTNCWWTFSNAGASAKKRARLESINAQRFHQDQEFISFVKVFVYLTDVGEQNGPHVYVRGSVNDHDKAPAQENVSYRFEDAEIEAAFGPDRVVSITGPAGQIAFVNTRGFHKGAPVVAGHRLLLQFEYASSMYFNPVKPFAVAHLSSAGTDLRRNAPRVFSNYRDLDLSAVADPELSEPHRLGVFARLRNALR